MRLSEEQHTALAVTKRIIERNVEGIRVSRKIQDGWPELIGHRGSRAVLGAYAYVEPRWENFRSPSGVLFFVPHSKATTQPKLTTFLYVFNKAFTAAYSFPMKAVNFSAHDDLFTVSKHDGKFYDLSIFVEMYGLDRIKGELI